MMIDRPILAAALGLLLAGCASTEQLAQRDQERCAARGLQPNSNEFTDCVTRLETERQLRTENRRMDYMIRTTPLRRD
jgi:hypothetical protein